MEIFKTIKPKYLISAVYIIAVIWMLAFVWREQRLAQSSGSSPIYRNLRKTPAFVKRGFNAEDLQTVPLAISGEWTQFKTQVRRIINSMPDLPKRKFLSPWGRKAEEFTILHLIEIDHEALSYITQNQHTPQVIPGMYFAGIGENWEVYFNGKLILSEMHLDENGRIKSNRTWRDVHFPLDSSLFVPGTNILALRIIGDPTYTATGLFYNSAPIYMDDYSIIQDRQQHTLVKILCGIFGFIGFYYVMLFFRLMRKEEIYNLYFGIFSIILCFYSITRSGWVNSIIPNANIATRLEYLSLMMSIPVVGMFIESLGAGKITKISRGYFLLSLSFSLTQIFFCLQYSDEIVGIWNVITFFYVCYLFIYDVIYCYLWKWFKNRGNLNTPSIGYVFFGITVMTVCGTLDIIDILFIGTGLHIFHYSIFTAQVGMAIMLMERFSKMFNRLELTNIELEAEVRERTMELEKQTKLAVQASRAKSEFLANMSHEIRTPMNSIIGFSELAMIGDINPGTKEYLCKIKDNTIGLLQIIDDILDISKVESGKLELRPVPFDLNELLSQCQTVITPLALEKLLELNFNIDKSINKKLKGDPVRLRQILLNILSNAVKFTETGSVKASVIVKQETKNGCTIYFEVSDTGIGMTEEQMKMIYEPFMQADSGLTRKYGGSGLGLPIVKNLIELMGSKLHITSAPGKGSTFSFEIDFHFAESKAIKKDTDSLKFKNKKPVFDAEILVCEDSLTNQQVLCENLTYVGIKTVTAQNGKEGLDIVEERIKSGSKLFDLIFMDIQMPVMDGIEAAAKITALNTGIPIVAITANVMPHDLELYKKNHMPDCVGKPFTARQLWDCLLKYLTPVRMENMPTIL